MSDGAERWVDVPGGKVWTATHGAADAPALMILHGGPGMPSDYLEGLAALADTSRVVFYDQLGCGRSERPDDSDLWNVDRSVAEVEAVRTALELGPVALLGHSWGGYLALSYAEAHRDAITALILSSPLVSVADWMRDAAILLSRLPDATRGVIEAHEAAGRFDTPEYEAATMVFYRRYLCNLRPWPEALTRTFDAMGTGPYHTMWGPSEFTQTGNLRGGDRTPLLDALGCPTLWMCGTDDEVRPATLSRFAERAGGRTDVFEGGTHCVHLEQPDAYLRAVRRFLSQMPG